MTDDPENPSPSPVQLFIDKLKSKVPDPNSSMGKNVAAIINTWDRVGRGEILLSHKDLSDEEIPRQEVRNALIAVITPLYVLKLKNIIDENDERFIQEQTFKIVATQYRGELPLVRELAAERFGWKMDDQKNKEFFDSL